MLIAKLSLPALLILAAAAAGPGARAAMRQASITGKAVLVDSPCARHVDIRPDPALQGQVAVDATAEHQQELDHLQFVTDGQGRAAVRTLPGSCWKPLPFASFDPTLQIVVRVPAGFAVSVDESGAGRYMIGDIGGPLSLDVSGAAHIEAGRATTLSVDLSGAGAVNLARALDDASIGVSGHGSVEIGEAAMGALSVDLSGAGSVTIGKGHIGHAAIEESGFGQVGIGADVGDAKVDISGMGSVHFARVSGSIDKDVSGAGSVTVGQ